MVLKEEVSISRSRFRRETTLAEFASYFFVITVFFDFYIVADIRISDMMLFIAFASYTFHIVRSKLKIPLNPILILLVFWLVSWCLGFFTLNYLDYSRETALYKYWGYGLKLVSYIFIVIVLTNLRRSSLKRIVTAIQVVIFVRLIYVLLLVFISNDFYRVTITGKNTNVDGFLAVLMLFYSALVSSKNRAVNIVRYSCVLMSAIYLFLTAARAALIASVSILLLYFLSIRLRSLLSRGILIRDFRIRFRTAVIFLLFLGVLLATGVLYDFNLTGVSEDLTRNMYRIRGAATFMEDASFFHRIKYQWPEIIDLWKRNVVTVLVGTGYGTLDRSDGLYVKLLAETGLVGLALFLILIAKASIKAISKKPTRLEIVFTLITACFLVIGFTNEVFYVYRAMEIYIMFYSLSLNFKERSLDEDSSCS